MQEPRGKRSTDGDDHRLAYKDERKRQRRGDQGSCQRQPMVRARIIPRNRSPQADEASAGIPRLDSRRLRTPVRHPQLGPRLLLRQRRRPRRRPPARRVRRTAPSISRNSSMSFASATSSSPASSASPTSSSTASAQIHEAFSNAIKDHEYKGEYRCVYPIKVNQQRHVVEEILDFGKQYGFGLEAGSKPELLAVHGAWSTTTTRRSSATASRTMSSSRRSSWRPRSARTSSRSSKNSASWN